MKKKSIALILSLLLLEVGFSGNVLAAGYPDMPGPDHWSRPALEQAVSNGLLYGSEGKIRPEANLQRSEMAAILNRSFAAENKGSLDEYIDIEAGKWYYDDMAKAIAMETFKGDDQNRLNPEKLITRQEVFSVVSRALDLEARTDQPGGYLDLGEIDSWARDSVYAMIDAGYVKGSEGRVNPRGNITRAEFAQVMTNIVAEYNLENGKLSDGNVMINKAETVVEDAVIKGDLIIADGVGEGDVTLSNVRVEGRLLVRGGGLDSILIKGNSEINTIISRKVKGGVRIGLGQEAKVGELVLKGSDTQATIEGEVGSLTIDKTAQTARVDIKESGQVKRLEVNSPAARIEGQGRLGEVLINEDKVNVDIKADKITIKDGVVGTVIEDSQDGLLDVSIKNGRTDKYKRKVELVIDIEDSNSRPVENLLAEDFQVHMYELSSYAWNIGFDDKLLFSNFSEKGKGGYSVDFYAPYDEENYKMESLTIKNKMLKNNTIYKIQTGQLSENLDYEQSIGYIESKLGPIKGRTAKIEIEVVAADGRKISDLQADDFQTKIAGGYYRDLWNYSFDDEQTFKNFKNEGNGLYSVEFHKASHDYKTVYNFTDIRAGKYIIKDKLEVDLE